MYRLNQTIRNLFIRLEGLLYQFFGFFGKLFGWLNQLFLFLGGILGFKSPDFLEDEVQSVKPDKAEPVAASTPEYSPPATSTTRRRPDANMDYYLKMARQEKNSR